MLLLMQHLGVVALRRTIDPEDTQRILENNSLGIALADPLGLDTIVAYRFLFAAFNATFPTSYGARSTLEFGGGIILL